MDEPLLTTEDRATLREFAASQMSGRPHLLPAGSAMADQFRQLVPALADEQLAAATACAAQVAAHHAQVTGCPHVNSVALLLQAVAVDLAHLELDPPGRQ